VIGGERGLATPIPGGPPDPSELPQGCHFRPRCPYAQEECLQDPKLREVSARHAAACHFAPWKSWPEVEAPAPAAEAAG
jgi:peptide/nickel transport system ATP-binding protein